MIMMNSDVPGLCGVVHRFGDLEQRENMFCYWSEALI